MNSVTLNEKLVIGMVGLPARGKTYYATKINKYLRWLGIHSRHISIDHYKKCLEISDPESLFNFEDEKAGEVREQLELLALEDAIAFLEGNGQVVIYDTFTFSKEKRKMLKGIFDSSSASPQIFWIDCQSNKESLIKLILSQDLKFAQELAHVDKEIGNGIYEHRLSCLKKVYEEVRENEYKGVSFVRFQNLNEEVTIFNVAGYFSSRLLSFMLNLRVRPHAIYLLMHGTTLQTSEKKAGCDPELTLDSQKCARIIGEYLSSEFESSEKPLVFSSSLKRSLNTAEALGIKGEFVSLKALDDIDYGKMHGVSSKEIQEYLMTSSNPISIRFPQGESYLDLIERLEPVIIEIERTQGPVVVVGHRSVIRCIYAYFSQKDLKAELPFLEISLNSVIKLIPEMHSCEEKWLEMNEDGFMTVKEFETLETVPLISRRSRFNSLGPLKKDHV